MTDDHEHEWTVWAPGVRVCDCGVVRRGNVK